MFPFLMALSLVFGIPNESLPQASLLEERGILAPNAQQVYQLPKTQQDVSLNVMAMGSSKGGDLDCYLLIKHPGGGYVIVSKDEDNVNWCMLGIIPRSEDPIRVWIVNHGTSVTHFTLRVTQ